MLCVYLASSLHSLCSLASEQSECNEEAKYTHNIKSLNTILIYYGYRSLHLNFQEKGTAPYPWLPPIASFIGFKAKKNPAKPVASKGY